MRVQCADHSATLPPLKLNLIMEVLFISGTINLLGFLQKLIEI